MGATLRNVFLLLALALLTAKGVGYFAQRAAKPPPAQVHEVAPEPAFAARQDDAGAWSDGELVLEAQRNGHFLLEARVDGRDVTFMVDTGASAVVLRPEDARRLGFYPGTLDYDVVFETANGRAHAAMVTLRELTIGELELADVPAAVVQQPMPISLLGMTALSRLDSYRVEGERMILRW